MELKEIKIMIPAYSKETGIRYNWERGSNIETRIDDGAVVIKGNKAGFISLANHLLNLAQDEVPSGHHMHFDVSNSLEKDQLN